MDSIIDFDFLNKSNIYIYGAGECGNLIQRILQQLELSIDGFIDSDRTKHYTKINEIEVIPIETLDECSSAVVIVSIVKENDYDVVCNKLVEYNATVINYTKIIKLWETYYIGHALLCDGLTYKNAKDLYRTKKIVDEIQHIKTKKIIDELIQQYDLEILPGLKKINNSVKEDKTIWMFWDNGFEKAPPIVRQCVKSVKLNAPEDWEVRLLSVENLEEYIVIPNSISRALELGVINTTKFSNYIRLCLLESYGGCWIDATVYCSGRIPNYLLSGDMFMFCVPGIHGYSTIKISSWWMQSKKENIFISKTRKVWELVINKGGICDDYFWLHVIFSALIESDKTCGMLYNNMLKISASNAHILQAKLDEDYSIAAWNNICEISSIHKLSCKLKLENKNSFYTNLINDECGE